MKVGVLTLPLIDNYGGIVQAIALCSYLEAQGHDVVLIQKPHSVPPRGFMPHVKAAVRWLLVRIPFQDYKRLRSLHEERLKLARLKAFHRPFVEKAIRHISPDLHITDELKAFASRERFDAIIVGSDQVWRKRYINNPYYQSYFLDFVDGKTCRKIAYAASFGMDKWEGSGDEERIGRLLADFHAVSTREQSGVRICRETFGYSGAVHLLDPTLLMDRDFYVNRIIIPNVSRDFRVNDLLTYVLDEEPEKAAIIRQAMDATGFTAATHLKGFGEKDRVHSVPEWLAGFHHANFVVTDSFHGVIFSILFGKNFIAIGNHGRGMERFTSLLSQIGLEDRLVFKVADLTHSHFSPIDYPRVRASLQPLRDRSAAFLAEALGGSPA